MKRKLVILITILLISASLLGCKDPYEGAMVGAWQDSDGLVGIVFREDETCEITFAREFITETVSCAYHYTDGEVLIYNPRIYTLDDFDLKNLNSVEDDQGIVFDIDREKKDGVVDGFGLVSLWMEPCIAITVSSFSDWENSLYANGLSLNEAASIYTGTKFSSVVIDWIQEALIE